MSNIPNTRQFVNCEICGKRLIEKRQNIWYFSFGKSVLKPSAPVEIYIFGTIKIKCLRKNCNHWNVFNCFTEEKPDGIH